MNGIESTKETLKKIRDSISSSSVELNSALTLAGISKIDFGDAIKKIEKQIISAENKFTIAFVGTFKTGKSTIINSLLNLKGDSRLSSELDPDTARCIRIIEKGNREYEAEVDFGDSYPMERLPWKEAKKYTSQVALDLADDNFKKRAKKIKEVRYYVDSPLLSLCNILDLPGTGTGGYSEHTDVTDEKIMESDCFFWVLSTDCEPSLESIENLKKIKHKLLPIINVWQYEKEEIRGDFLPEDIIEIIQDGYSEYLNNAENPIIYYAKEIDMAQQEGREVKEEWGKEQFVEKVQEVLLNVQSGDRANRIKHNLLGAFNSCQEKIDTVKNNSKLDELRIISQKNQTENNNQLLPSFHKKKRQVVITLEKELSKIGKSEDIIEQINVYEEAKKELSKYYNKFCISLNKKFEGEIENPFTVLSEKLKNIFKIIKRGE